MSIWNRPARSSARHVDYGGQSSWTTEQPDGATASLVSTQPTDATRLRQEDDAEYREVRRNRNYMERSRMHGRGAVGAAAHKAGARRRDF